MVQVLEAASKLRPGTTIITTSGHQTHSNTTPDTTADMEEPDAVVEVKPRQVIKNRVPTVPFQFSSNRVILTLLRTFERSST